jgi:hypothetical protein
MNPYQKNSMGPENKKKRIDPKTIEKFKNA